MKPIDFNTPTGVKLRVMKRPIEIQAMIIETRADFVGALMEMDLGPDDWAVDDNNNPQVRTKEGWFTGKWRDALMKGVQGEFYLCDRTIFEQTYGIVEEK